MKLNKKNISSAALLLAAAFLTLPMKAQVTIGALVKPNSTLDVVKLPDNSATADGIMAPRLTGDQLKATDAKYTAAQTSAIVYATSASPDANVPGAKTANVSAPGYYYFDGAQWQSIGIVAASNGLTKVASSSGSSVLLGGTLTQATTIAQGTNNLTFTGTGKTVISAPLQYTDGNQAGGKVLTSDPNGNATWQIPETALTIRGTVTQFQNKQIPINFFDGAGSTGGGIVSMDPLSYIDIPPGLWRIDASIPFGFNDAVNANSWIEFLVFFSTNSTTTDANTAINAGNCYPTFVQSPFPAGLFSRGSGFTFLNNTSGVTQRYYAGIGRVTGPATWTTDFAGKTITYLGTGITAYIYATSTNFAP